MTDKNLSKEEILNIIPNFRGELVERKGWKTLRGAMTEIKRINKNCKKLGFATKITIDLPLKP